MKFRSGAPAVLVLLALLVSSTTLASTGVISVTITGTTTPPPNPLTLSFFNNTTLEVMAALPVVSTVTGSPASIAASLNMGTTLFNTCGSTACSGDLWAGQWTIVSAPTGIQAVAAYQGSSIRLVNNSGSSVNLTLRCQVGNMTGSCIFLIRITPISDPLF
ncbi:MAG: hypothetical protein LC796_00590 [Acidobacteria bacterium]|nr:hypothetical protein [Acidobacteriota bacterium]MCA1609498.1 hypothetical protein [Acidobacteriota bacterium]